MKNRRRKAARRQSPDGPPRPRAHEEFPPGTPIPRDLLQLRLCELHEDVARLERPSFDRATAVMVGALAVLVTAEGGIAAATDGTVRWLLLVLVLGIAVVIGLIAGRLADRAGPDDDVRAALLGDIAFLGAARIVDPLLDDTQRRSRRTWRGPRSA